MLDVLKIMRYNIIKIKIKKAHMAGGKHHENHHNSSKWSTTSC